MKKIIYKGNVFNPTGIATANRELAKAVSKLGVQIECADVWNDNWDFNKGLSYLTMPILDSSEDVCTIFADYPQFWRDGLGKVVGFFLHEGTKLHAGWSDVMNTVDLVLVPSQATKNLFKSNDVATDIKVVPYGTNTEIYKPKAFSRDENFLFLSVNSWGGVPNDRKGTDLLIKAFDEEFKPEEKVKLILKIGTFWQKTSTEFYGKAIFDILGHTNENIVYSNAYVPEEDLATYYQQADCFVAPTRGEAFGLTILNAMACGLPVIVTKDNNSGHMDFCRGKDSVLWIDVDKMDQADLRFFAEGNMQPVPSVQSLRKQMRFAFENRVDLNLKGLRNSQDIANNWTWEHSAKKLMEAIK